MGLIVQKVEPGGKIHADGRIQENDRIIAINRTGLIGVDFLHAQEILREAIHQSNLSGHLEFKIFRMCVVAPDSNNFEDEVAHEEEEEALLMMQQGDEERPIEYIDDVASNNKENDIDSHGNHNNNNMTTSAINLGALTNTKRLGKRIVVQLVKGQQGLGFKLAARDNCSQGEFSPIYIKSILPKGAAITDGRLQRGDRLLEVNGLDMTQKTLHEAVNILRNTKMGTCVEIVVSRQTLPTGNSMTSSMTTATTNTAQSIQNVASQLQESQANEQEPESVTASCTTSQQNTLRGSGATNQSEQRRRPKKTKRELLTFEIAFNDTGSAGLGVSVKGKTKRLDDESAAGASVSAASIDLGIFVKTVINGGAASKDGRLRPNDQLINVNGFSLLGKSNEEAMLILRDAMQYESAHPDYIELTVSRKSKLTNERNATSNVSRRSRKSLNLHDLEDDEYDDAGIDRRVGLEDEDDAEEEDMMTRSNTKSNEKQIVKVITHQPTQPIPATATVTNTNNSSARFNRDAPGRRSMSEKRTKLGQVPSNIITSAAASSSRQQRAGSGRNDIYQNSSTAKRSQTAHTIHQTATTVVNTVVSTPKIEHHTRPQQSAPLTATVPPSPKPPSSTNIPIEIEKKIRVNNSSCAPQLSSKAEADYFTRMGSFESVVNRNSIQLQLNSLTSK
jgi:partitioning defective protein 3